MATAEQELVTLDEAGLRALSQADEGIAELKERYLPLAIKGPDDTNGFKLVHAARMDVRNRRVGIEKTRKSLKADALEFGRRVDAEAKRITDQLSVIEEHLDAQETAYEDAREAIKRKAEEAKQAVLQARIDALRAVDVVLPVLQVAALTDDAFANLLADADRDHKAKLAKIEAERVERERLEAEAAAARKAEDERLAKERAELEAERKRIAAEQAEQERIADEAAAKERASIEAERKRMAEEQAKIDAERRKVEEAAAEQRRQVELAKAREEAAERARIEEQERARREDEAAKQQAAAEEAARREAEELRPDKEKLLALSEVIRAITVPAVVKPKAKELADNIAKELATLANFVSAKAKLLR